MRVSIIFKGVGLNYLNDAGWKIIFPFDSCHQLNLTCQKNDDPPEDLGPQAAADTAIVLTVTDAVPTTGADPDMDDFVDLTANYSHSDGINFKESWRDYGVELTLTSGTLSVNDYSGSEFVVADNTSEITKAPATVGASLLGEVDVGEGSALEISVGEIILKSIKYEQGAVYTLVFDNDCYLVGRESPGLNDFKMFYTIIEDAVDSGTEYELSDVPAGAYPPDYAVGQTLPTTSGQFEFPCYIARATKVNKTFP
jgi:hypothetical protein